MQEIWKPVPSYEGLYEVSNLGNIKSLDRFVAHIGNRKRKINEKILKQFSGKKDERLCVKLSKDCKTKTLRIHQIVMRAFVGEQPPNTEVCHNNGISTDNALSNLRYDTHIENIKDMEGHGTKLLGEKANGAKLKQSDIFEILKLYKSGISQIKIAKRYQVSRQQIGRIVRKEQWSWLE